MNYKCPATSGIVMREKMEEVAISWQVTQPTSDLTSMLSHTRYHQTRAQPVFYEALQLCQLTHQKCIQNALPTLSKYSQEKEVERQGRGEDKRMTFCFQKTNFLLFFENLPFCKVLSYCGRFCTSAVTLHWSPPCPPLWYLQDKMIRGQLNSLLPVERELKMY